MTTTFTNKYEQVMESARFVWQDLPPEAFDAIRTLPSKVNSSILRIVSNWPEPTGYHFNVLRAALRQYNTIGYLSGDEPPFTDEELYYG